MNRGLEKIRAKMALRKERRLAKQIAYIEERVQKSKSKGKDTFFLNHYASVSTETWIYLMENYQVNEVDGGWEIGW